MRISLERVVSHVIKNISTFNGIQSHTGMTVFWSYVNILDTKSQTFLCCTSS
ncbi:hypothetical protein [Clostridium celatum]|uniref:hypothetical protein n=1 Tax=Clostridium celatum TaxID=36834 RepID=UPI00189BBA31|nr:hypothetical protein [Clostridium celatum]